ncbi:hypothetical protein AVEN_3499-1 [Araneus ventricosus]|uniref:Uncharacterized protein n=1 Tax=Araneus ventricosus TaxID=182803 RepID=A0A4Y2JR91_ARAVE|nr:hypothetical protein AVEN_3499-1 [Araneus ventricosus]
MCTKSIQTIKVVTAGSLNIYIVNTICGSLAATACQSLSSSEPAFPPVSPVRPQKQLTVTISKWPLFQPWLTRLLLSRQNDPITLRWLSCPCQRLVSFLDTLLLLFLGGRNRVSLTTAMMAGGKSRLDFVFRAGCGRERMACVLDLGSNFVPLLEWFSITCWYDMVCFLHTDSLS